MPVPVRRLPLDELADATPALAALFVDAVADGASIGYLAGLDIAGAAEYWRRLADAPAGRSVLVAEDAEGIAGVIVVALMQGAFQPHRAELAKLVVHRRARGRGLGAALIAAAEAEALAQGRTVLTLMTRHGSAGEHLYRRRGWMLAGVIPRDSLAPDGTFADAAIFHKRLAGA